MARRWKADAPGKLVLIGEYAVLEGYPAAVIAVDRRARACIEEGSIWSLDAPELGFLDVAFELGTSGLHAPLPSGLGLVEEALMTHSSILCTRPAFHISLGSAELMMSTEGPKLGLGSSAAVATALTAVLANYCLVDWRPEDLLAQVHDLHFRFQGGRGSGIDVAAAALGGCLRYQMGEDRLPDRAPRSIQLPDNLYWRAVWSGSPASTPELIAAIRRWSTAEPAAHSGLMKKLGSIATEGVQALEASDTASFLGSVDEYEQALRELGAASSAAIVTAPHREIADIVRLAGGSYKPSGAGGGDLGLAFASSPSILREAEERLAQLGYPIVPLALAEDGIRVRH